MLMNHYRFVTHWRLQGTLDQVAEVLSKPERMAVWWPSVCLDVMPLQMDERPSAGNRYLLFTKGFLPYTLRWEMSIIEASPTRIRIASRGDFRGEGTWALVATDADVVEATYHWDIVADKPLIRYLSPILRKVFEFNHHWAMHQGEISLQIELDRLFCPQNLRNAHHETPPPTPMKFVPWLRQLHRARIIPRAA